MTKKYIPIFILTLVGLGASYYMLHLHHTLTAGDMPYSDVCSTVFGKSCGTALKSKYASMLGIPLGGWGMIYFSAITILTLISVWIRNLGQNKFLYFAFWVVTIGLGGSIFYLFKMATVPALVCPMCIVIHTLNIMLFFVLKHANGVSFAQLYKELFSFVTDFFKDSGPLTSSRALQSLGIIATTLMVLSIYQWVSLEDRKIMIQKMAKYDPVEEIEKYENETLREIKIPQNASWLGPADAPVALVVYSDFQCDICEMFASNFEDLVAYHSGNLKILFKHFPLSSQCNSIATRDLHVYACQAAYAAEAARMQGQFWPYHNKLFELNLEEAGEQGLLDAATELGLDLNRFKNDIRTEACANKVAADIKEGIEFEIDGTPAAFLNGRMVYDLRPKSLNLLIKYLAGPE